MFWILQTNRWINDGKSGYFVQFTEISQTNIYISKAFSFEENPAVPNFGNNPKKFSHRLPLKDPANFKPHSSASHSERITVNVEYPRIKRLIRSIKKIYPLRGPSENSSKYSFLWGITIKKVRYVRVLQENRPEYQE